MARSFGGFLFYNASQINFAGTPTYTRNALGDVSLNQGASLTVQYHMGVADLKRPFFTFPGIPGQGVTPTTNEFQEAFGTAAGGPSNPFSGGLSPTASQFGTPATPWGISVVDIVAYYAVGGAVLTTATLGLSRVTYAENTAITVTALIAATATATSITGAANACHVAKVAATAPLVFEATDNTDLLVELTLTTAAGGSARVYGLGMHVVAEYS
jgi:hypothetical protein